MPTPPNEPDQQPWRRSRIGQRLRRGMLAVVVVILVCMGGLEIALRVVPFPEAMLWESEAGGSTLLLTEAGERITWRVDGREAWRLPVPLDAVSPDLVAATIAAEDQRFYTHGGVDPVASLRAVWQMLRHRRRVSGASTLTMQCMRLAHPAPRTWRTKAVESFRAMQVERIRSKDDILAYYLNRAPYGGNVIGAEAAAQRFFGTSASGLTLGQAALLAGLPQRPAAFNPERHLVRALKRRAYVLHRMQALGLASLERVAVALREPIRLAPAPGVVAAPHFADHLLQTYRRQGGTFRTTLRGAVQTHAHRVLADFGRELADTGIDGAAVVVIDVRAGSLVAMVGGFDPGNPLTGQINGATRLRQPGSLLKPFLFAAACQDGHLTPDALVMDTPMSWDGYAPENMDRMYRGAMRAKDALRLSRNIPAVRTAARLTPERLARDMTALGLPFDRSADRAGLSLALGTQEVRLVDITNAYAALARLGVYHPLRVLVEEAATPGTRVYTPEAGYLALDSLRIKHDARVVWKTGTSWRHRDAWCVAVTPRHAVGVWVGRHTGEGHPFLTGEQAALPVALAVLAGIPGTMEETWTRPAGIAERSVCALSGTTPTHACPTQTRAAYIPGVSSDTPCRLHTRTPDGTLLTRLPDAYAPSGTRHAQGSVHPASFPAGGSPHPSTGTRHPPHDASTPKTGTAPHLQENGTLPTESTTTREAASLPSAAAPRIRFPQDGADYFIGKRHETMTFEAETASAPLVWFLNGKPLDTRTSQVHWHMQPGHHTLILSTADGTAHRIRFRIHSPLRQKLPPSPRQRMPPTPAGS